MSHGFQLESHGPAGYERYLVPALFDPCAEELLGFVRPIPGDRVLDLACGTGVVARKVAARVGRSGTVIGADVNAAMVAQASAAGPASIRWVTSDSDTLPMDDGSFDLVCCQQGFQFFADPAAALLEMHRVLAPGGRVAFAIWRHLPHQPAWSAFVDVLERYLDAETAAIMRAPFSDASREDLRRLLTNASFTGVELRIAGFLSRFPSAREFFRQQVASSPLAGPIGELGPAKVSEVLERVDAAFEPYTDDGGVVLPVQTWLVSAQR